MWFWRICLVSWDKRRTAQTQRALRFDRMRSPTTVEARAARNWLCLLKWAIPNSYAEEVNRQEFLSRESLPQLSIGATSKVKVEINHVINELLSFSYCIKIQHFVAKVTKQQ